MCENGYLSFWRRKAAACSILHSASLCKQLTNSYSAWVPRKASSLARVIIFLQSYCEIQFEVSYRSLYLFSECFVTILSNDPYQLLHSMGATEGLFFSESDNLPPVLLRELCKTIGCHTLYSQSLLFT